MDANYPAFPVPIKGPEWNNGMTLRQYYAGQALVTMMKATYIGSDESRKEYNREQMRHAVAMADMLIEELKK